MLDTAVAMIDLDIGDVLNGLITEACTHTLTRVTRVVVSKQHGGRRRPSAAESLLSFGEAEATPSLARLASEEFGAITVAQIRDVLANPSIASILKQISAASLLDELGDHKDSISLRFSIVVRRLLAGAEINDSALQVLFDVVVEGTEARFSGIKTEQRDKIIVEQLARAVLLQATVNQLVEDAKGAASSVRDQAVDDEWLSRYRAQCQRAHGFIMPPDNDRRRNIPINDIYVPGRIVPEVRSVDDEPETVYELLPKIDRSIILGDPGGGKSTATNAIAHSLSQNTSQVFPLVVVLRNYGGVMADESMVAFLERTIPAKYQTPAPPEGLIESLLHDGRALLLLDGLDELLDSSRRREMAERIELLSSAYPTAPMLVTSRRVGYDEARVDEQVFVTYFLSEHSDKDVEQYVRKWFALNTAASPGEAHDPELLANAFLSESESIRDLRSNPLLLALLCIIYRSQNYLPRNRIGIYEQCAKMLFETWDKSRGLSFNFSFDGHIDGALKHLAYWIFTRDGEASAVSESMLIEEITTFFTAQAYEEEGKARSAATQFIGFCKGRAWVLADAGVDNQGERVFTFAHRTFLEFYAASQLTRKFPDPDKLALMLVKHVSKNEWDNVGQLAVNLINKSVERGAEKTITRMITSANGANRTSEYRANVLLFVGRCLRDLPASPVVLRNTFVGMYNLVKATAHRRDSLNLPPQILENAIASLYRINTASEGRLDDVLDELASQSDGSDSDARTAHFVIVSCLRNAPTERMKALFYTRYIQDWGPGQLLSLHSLEIAYYHLDMTIPTIAGLLSEHGMGLLDPWLVWDRNNAFRSGTHHRLGFGFMQFQYSFPSAEERARNDSNHERWYGTLIEDIGAYINAEEVVPVLLTTDLKQLTVFDLVSRRRRAPGDQVSVNQLTCAYAVAAAITESESAKALMTQFVNDERPLPGVLSQAMAAKEHGAWSFSEDGPALAARFTGWLTEWASNELTFVTTRSPK